MNGFDIFAYILIFLAVGRLVLMQGRCPMAWVTLVVGLGILYHRGKLI